MPGTTYTPIKTEDLLHLRRVAGAVIHQLKKLPELKRDKLAVVGGLAVVTYCRYRDTKDVDFLIESEGAPQSVKKKLLALKDSPFREEAWKLYYQDRSGKRTAIDLISWRDFPYIPASATPIGKIQNGQLPYISINDLLAFKAFSCGVHDDDQNNERDAVDVLALVIDVTEPWLAV